LFGDADTAAIALAIASINAEQLLREKLPAELENLSVPLPDKLYRRCNINSIAVACGLNRETARRKILKLEQSGLLVRDGSEIRLSPGFTQRKEVREMVRLQLDELRKTADALLRDGVFVHQP